jgi:hypothetical protein
LGTSPSSFSIAMAQMEVITPPFWSVTPRP